MGPASFYRIPDGGGAPTARDRGGGHWYDNQHALPAQKIPLIFLMSFLCLLNVGSYSAMAAKTRRYLGAPSSASMPHSGTHWGPHLPQMPLYQRLTYK